MPELPEVESLRRMLSRSVVGRTIVAVKVGEPRLRRRVAPNFAATVAGRTIAALHRRAKYLIFDLSGGRAIIVHLGMSGSMTHRGANFAGDRFDRRHDHAYLELDDGSLLVYNDPRRFGLLKAVRDSQIESIAELKALGPEPIGDGFDADYLAKKARGRKRAIKNLLMDQRVVAGVGNIYASEILFRACVRPTRRAGRLKRAEIERIVAQTPEVLREAVEGSGTTFDGRWRGLDGTPGSFRPLVYDRDGKPCYLCGTPIRRITLGQRSSFYCPKCQR